jgi:asparagine synthetase B (glutamine-hydrolysing)
MAKMEIPAEHHEVEFRGEMIPDLLPKVVRGLDTPCLASPALLQYQLATAATGIVKSVLGGEGADEQFAGYSWLAPSPAYALQAWAPSGWARSAANHVRDLRVRRLLRQVAARDAMAADAEGYRLLSPLE